MDDLLVKTIVGLGILLIGGVFYKSGDRFFSVGGLFQSKEVALVVLIGALIVTHYVSEILTQIVVTLQDSFSSIQGLGIIAVIGIVVLNTLVGNWRYFDRTSMAIMLGGGFLIIFF